MTEPADELSLPTCVARILDAIPFPGQEVTTAQAEEGQRCRGIITQQPAAAVPALLDRLRDGEFPIQNACFRLLVELGDDAGPALVGGLGQRGPETDIWIAGALRHRGDLDPGVLSELLDHPEAPVRDLAALALALAVLERDEGASPRLLERLVDALGSDRVISSTPFRVADSAAVCLDRLGAPGLSVAAPMELHNDQHFAFPPPSPPFPLASSAVGESGPAEVTALQTAVRGWIASEGHRS